MMDKPGDVITFNCEEENVPTGHEFKIVDGRYNVWQCCVCGHQEDKELTDIKLHRNTEAG